MPPARPVAVHVDAPSSAWDRITSWASENKAVAYTIAGVAVIVTGAGVVYLLNSESVCNQALVCGHYLAQFYLFNAPSNLR